MEVEEIIASAVSFILLAGIVTVGRFSKKPRLPRRWQFLSGIILLFGHIAIAKVPCDPESFEFDESPRLVDKFGTYTFKINNAKEIGCAINVTYDWMLYRVLGNELVQIPLEKKALEYPGKSRTTINKLDMRRLQIEENDRDAEFALKVTLIPDPTHYPSYRIWYFGLNVPVPTSLVISGGAERTHILGQGGMHLWLNVSSTSATTVHNPVWDCSPPVRGDPPPNTPKWAIAEPALVENMTYTCTVTADLPSGQRESASQVIHIRSYKDIPQIELRCSENCEQSNANEVTTIDCYCHSHCQGKVSWTVIPYAESYMKDSTIKHEGEFPTLISFKGKTFKPGSSMDVIAALGEATANYTLHFMRLKPVLEIKCVDNCETYDPNLGMKFEVSCSSDCDNLNLTWEMQPTPSDQSTFEPPLQGSKTIFFPANSFLAETSVTLWTRSDLGTAEFNFKTAKSMKHTVVIECVNNCQPTDPRLPCEIEIKCPDCKGSISGITTKPHPTGFRWYEHTLNNNHTLIFPPNSFKDKDKVDIGVEAGPGEFGNATFTFEEKEAVLQVKCVENCESDNTHPNAHSPVKVEVSCSSNCDIGRYNWWLEPSPPDFNYAYQVQDNGTYLIIPAEKYKEGESVKILVTKGKGKADLVIKFAELKPDIEIICMKNCIKPVNYNLDTTLEVLCKSSCEDVPLTWAPSPAPTLWYEHFELKDNNRTLNIKGGTYKDKDVVDYTVYTKNSVEKHLILNYATQKPAATLNCVQNCDHPWISEETVYEIRCFMNCENASYVLTLEPEPKNMKWAEDIILSENNETITIKPYVFKHGDKVDLILNIKPITDKADDTKTLEFEELIAELQLICSPNGCNTTVNNLERVSLEVMCIKNCMSTNYRWSIEPKGSFNWDKSKIQGNTLQILPGAFKNDNNITVTVSSDSLNRSTASSYFVFKAPKPEFQILCDDNCKFSNPRQPVLLHAQCDYLCEYIDKFEWKLNPRASKKGGTVVTQKGLTILANSYKDGAIVDATATSGLANNTMTLYFLEPPPVIEIVCLRNCDYNPKAPTTFEVHCKKHCMEDMKYKWKLIPNPKKQETYNKEKTLVTLLESSYSVYDTLNLTVTSGKGFDTKFAIFKDAKPLLHLNCIENCDKYGNARPGKTTTLEATCISDCETFVNGWVFWFIDKPPINFEPKNDFILNENQSIMTVRAGLFINDTHVRFDVTSGGTKVSFDVYFFEPIPILGVLCVDNCGFPYPFQKLKVNVTCFEHCDNLLNYTWEVFPPRKFENSNNNETLSLPAGSFQDYDQVLITVRNGASKATALYTFTVPPPVIKIFCKPSCHDVDPLEDLTLQVKCLEFCHKPFYIWGIRPTLPGFVWPLNVTEGDHNSSITLAANTFIDGSVTNVIVVSNKSAYNMTTVEFKEKLPHLEIQCKLNCKFNPKYKLELQVKCFKNCKQLNINCTFTPPPHTPRFVTQKNGELIFLNNAYINKDDVLVRCTGRNAQVETMIMFRENLGDGNCVLQPNDGNGVSGVTYHTIDCIHIRANLTFRVYQAIPNFQGKGVLLWHGIHSTIENLLFSPASSSERRILVLQGNGWDPEEDFRLRMRDREYTAKADWITLKYRILGEKPGDFHQLLKNEKYQQAIQLAAALDSALELSPPLFEVHYRRHILEEILTVMDHIEPSQVLSLMTKMAFKNYVHTPVTYHLLMEGVLSSIERILNWNESYPIYKNNILKEIAGDALETTGKIVKDLRYVKGMSTIKKRFSTADHTSDTDYIMHAGDRRHLMYVTKDALTAVALLTEGYKIWDKATTFNRGGILTKNLYIKPFQKGGLIKTDEGSKSFVTVKPFKSKDSKINPLALSKDVTLKIAIFTRSPFWWDNSVNSVKAEIIYFGLSTEGTNLVEADFNIYFNLLKEVKPGYLKGSVSNETKLAIYAFKVPRRSLLQMRINGLSLKVAVGNWQPTLELIKENGTEVNNSSDVHFYTEFKLVYVGITGDSTFSIEYSSHQCFAWHGDTWEWDTENCRPLPRPKEYQNFVICRCKRLSVFTANATVSKFAHIKPNLEKLPRNLKQHWYVPVITALAVVCIIIAMVLAVIRDNNVIKRNKLNILKDNNANDAEMYLIAVQTGLWKDSGTTARVALQIEGTQRVSRVHLLNGNDESLLQRNSATCFVLYTRRNLGKITGLKVWHDSFGARPHWYCSTIVVRHVATRKIYMFSICQWFSLILGEGRTYGKFQPKKKHSPLCFGTRFEESVRTSYNALGYWTDRITPHSSKEHVAATSTSILVMMMTLVLMIPDVTIPFRTSCFMVLLAATIGDSIASFFGILFRESESKVPEGQN